MPVISLATQWALQLSEEPELQAGGHPFSRRPKTVTCSRALHTRATFCTRRNAAAACFPHLSFLLPGMEAVRPCLQGSASLTSSNSPQVAADRVLLFLRRGERHSRAHAATPHPPAGSSLACMAPCRRGTYSTPPVRSQSGGAAGGGVQGMGRP